MLFLPAFSCERTEPAPDQQPDNSLSTPFLLDTKSLPEGSHTYRVVMTTLDGQKKGEGSYCNQIIEPGEKGSWLSPCRVNNNGDPLTSDGGTIATNFDEADKASIYGLRFQVQFLDVFHFSAASPAIQLKNDNGAYFPWTADKELYLCDGENVEFEGSWIGTQYVFNPKNHASLELIERRARLFIHIKCGQQLSADLQSVDLDYVNTARWYVTSGFSSRDGHFTRDTTHLFNHKTDGGILHLQKDPEISWSNGDTDYILPVDYGKRENLNLQPKVIVKLGESLEKPIVIPIEITQDIQPMHDYQLDIEISSMQILFKLSAEPWYDGGTVSTAEEEWATIATGAVTWDTLGNTIDTDTWNTNWPQNN